MIFKAVIFLIVVFLKSIFPKYFGIIFNQERHVQIRLFLAPI